MAKLEDVIMRDTHASRPSAGTTGRLYYETDTQTLFRDSGSAWESIEGAGTFVDPMTTAGDIIYENGGATRLPIGINGQVLTTVSGFPAWATPVSTGGGGLTASGYAFVFDIPPVSPHALDDEFNGVTIDPKWSDISSGSNLQWTKVVADGWLVAEPAQAGTSSTGKYLMGIRQNSPSGDFTVTAKIADTYRADDCRAGIFVSDGTTMHICGTNIAQVNPTTAAAIASAHYSETTDGGVYDGFYVQARDTTNATVWVRIRWVSASSTFYFDYSLNGVLWTPITSRGSQSQPTRVGLCQYSQNGGVLVADHQFACDWFRVTEP